MNKVHSEDAMVGSPTGFEQEIVYSRPALWPPFYAVGMVARVQGEVPLELAQQALHKLRVLHPPLAGHVRSEANGRAFLTTTGVGEFPLEVRDREGDDDCYRLLLQQERVPFPFDRGPVARFYLLRGPKTSDLVVVAPHVVCDGYSMTHVMWDAVSLLNDPDRPVAPPPVPQQVSWQTVPHAFYDRLLLRGLVRLVNLAWPGPRLAMQQEIYEQAHRQYWAEHENGLLHFSLSPAETSSLAAGCRQHGISMAGTLVAAFLLARRDVLPERRPIPREVSVAVNIRDRMAPSPGEAVGVFASSIDIRLVPAEGESFWVLAAKAHRRIHKAMGDRGQILMPLVLAGLDPRIIDALVVALATDQWERVFRLVTHFVRMKETVRSLNISNIGRVQLPDAGAPYRLETLLPFPPLVPGGELALNVLTINGRMNVVLRYELSAFAAEEVARIKERALWYLAEG